jgi:hypothetical protein
VVEVGERAIGARAGAGNGGEGNLLAAIHFPGAIQIVLDFIAKAGLEIPAE